MQFISQRFIIRGGLFSVPGGPLPAALHTAAESLLDTLFRLGYTLYEIKRMIFAVSHGNPVMLFLNLK